MVKRQASTPRGMAGSSKRAKTTPAARKTIGKIAKQVVMRMAEKKVHRSWVSEAALSSASVGNNFINLSSVTQGTGWGERTGKEIRLSKVRVKGLLHNNASGTHVVRMVIGYALDQADLSSTTELFEAKVSSGGPLTGVGIGGGDGVTALLLPLNRAKFIPLVDRLIKIGANSSVDGANVRTFDITKALREAKIIFEGTTVGAANQSRTLHVGFWTAEGGNDTAGGTNVEVSIVADLHFTDL